MIAAIVAGGIGSRMGGDVPKQFLMLRNRPILVHTAEQFLQHPSIEAVIIGITPDWYETAENIRQQYWPHRPVYLTNGGQNRSETIVNIIDFAAKQLSCADDTIVLSHDAVRPFVTSQMIQDSIEAMSRYEICTAAIPETDTVAYSEDGQCAAHFPERKYLYRIQTPQTFRLGTFQRVYSTLTPQQKAAATDVCSLFRQQGYPVALIPGDTRNIKVTFPDDLIVLEGFALQTSQQGLTSCRPQAFEKPAKNFSFDDS